MPESTDYGSPKPRKGAVTFESVVDAAYQVMREGKRPTIDKVRDITGGSPNVIHGHLAKFWAQLVPPNGQVGGPLGLPPAVWDLAHKLCVAALEDAERVAAGKAEGTVIAEKDVRLGYLVEAEGYRLRERAFTEDLQQAKARISELELSRLNLLQQIGKDAAEIGTQAASLQRREEEVNELRRVIDGRLASLVTEMVERRRRRRAAPRRPTKSRRAAKPVQRKPKRKSSKSGRRTHQRK